MEPTTWDEATFTYSRLITLRHDELQEIVASEPGKAAGLVEAAAKLGFVTAQMVWAQMLLDGIGTRQDQAAAFRWFEIATVSRQPEALNMLGRYHEVGWGCAVDYAEAARLYEEAAATGYDWAQFNLATLLFSGAGVTQDYREALALYVRAARQGHAKAMTVIGRYREEGWTIRRCPSSARQWYERAAKRGDFRAHYALACMMRVAGNRAQSLIHFEQAIEGGFPSFCRDIAADMLVDPDDEMRRLGRRAPERACASGARDDFLRYAAALDGGIGGDPDNEVAAAWRCKADAQMLKAGLKPHPRRRGRKGLVQVLLRRFTSPPCVRLL